MLSSALTALLALSASSLVHAIPQASGGPTIQSMVAYQGKTYYYNACYDELKGGLKALNHEVSVASGLITPESCVAACADAGYALSGLMNGSTCVCDNAISAQAPKLKNSDCSTVCTADSSKFCGGTWHLQVYYSKKTSKLPNPVAPASVGSGNQKYESLGCWTSEHDERALQGHYIGADDMTPASCAAQCYALGFKLAGTHYGRECFCGQRLIGSKHTSASSCSQACAGDTTTLCGSDDTINLYVAKDAPDVAGPKFFVGGIFNAYFEIGCYVDDTNNRLLPTYSFSAPDMTADRCARLAGERRLAYFGVENGNECFAADKLPNTADLVDPSQCSTPCAGGPSYTCGGGGRIDVYKSPLWSIF